MKKCFSIFMLVAALGGITTITAGFLERMPQRERMQRERMQREGIMQKIQEKVDQMNTAYKNAVSSLTKWENSTFKKNLEQQIASAQQQIASAQKQIASAQKQIASNENKITKTLKLELNTILPNFRALGDFFNQYNKFNISKKTIQNRITYIKGIIDYFGNYKNNRYIIEDFLQYFQ